MHALCVNCRHAELKGLARRFDLFIAQRMADCVYTKGRREK